MAKNQHVVINGYRIPGGRGGVAVLKACQMVRQNPGIKQTELIGHVTSWANLNLSTSGWITSPGPKSPAGILWDRRKEGRGFRCYPNAATPDLDPRVPLRDIVRREFDLIWGDAGRPEVGDMVILTHYQGGAPGIVTGFSVWHKWHKAHVYFEGRDSLDVLENYDRGDFRIHPVVLSGGVLGEYVMHQIHKVK